ncbi:unnamed protein product [Prunus armeniaca]
MAAGHFAATTPKPIRLIQSSYLLAKPNPTIFFATKNQHFIIGLKGSSVSLSMSSWRTKKQSTHLENCTEKGQEAADSQIPIVIPSVRVAEKLSRKKSERFAYLVAAMMSSFGITSMAVRLFITDFTGKWRVGMCLCLKCWVHLLYLLVLLGWEGSAHDSKLLNDALSRRNGLKVPQGKYFLVDCGFPNRRQFLAPFRGVRYHLQDFAGHGNDPKKENELFNLRHASLRNVIERIFGIFKSQFTIFKSAPPFPFKTQAELVLACVALHNFLRKECRSDEFPI